MLELYQPTTIIEGLQRFTTGIQDSMLVPGIVLGCLLLYYIYNLSAFISIVNSSKMLMYSD